MANILRRAVRRISFEEIADGKAFKEIEHTFYARLDDFDQLKKAISFEHQEQWELKFPRTDKNAGNGSIRVRKTVVGNSPEEYVLTVKTVLNGDGDKMEVPIPTTKAMFDQFRVLSEKGMKKDRYFFPIEGSDLRWEVDVFHSPGNDVAAGQYCPWVKLDLEVKDRSAAIPPLPMAFAEIITEPYGERTKEEEMQVCLLYEKFFTMRNQFLK